jgi:hypothetical protein
MTRLRSECGRYLAERLSECWRYRLYDCEGNALGESTFWSNCSTKTRIAFETGFGSIRAKFGYRRYPRWFRRRWVLVFDIKIDELAAIVKQHGGVVLVGFKPDWNCWSHIGFRATSEQLRAIDEELTRRGAEWNGPPRKSSQWDIEYRREKKATAEATA